MPISKSLVQPFRKPMVLVGSGFRGYFAPYVQGASPAPTIFDPARQGRFDTNTPPAGWYDLGWIDQFRRSPAGRIGQLRSGYRGAVRAQYRGELGSSLEFEFREWGKLQMALATGTTHFNILKAVAGAPEQPIGGTPAAAVALGAGSTASSLVLVAGGGAQFQVGQFIAVDVDYSGQSGYIGSGIQAAFVQTASVTDTDYVRRVTFNVGMTENLLSDSLLTVDTVGFDAESFTMQDVEMADNQPGGGLYLVKRTGDAGRRLKIAVLGSNRGWSTAMTNGTNIELGFAGTTSSNLLGGMTATSQFATLNNGILRAGGATHALGRTTGITNVTLAIDQVNVGNPAVVVKGIPSIAGDLQQWRTDADVVRAKVSQNYRFAICNSARTSCTELVANPTANRSATFPDATITVAGLEIAQTFSGVQTFSQQMVSSVATGTAPFSIASTTEVANLNSQRWHGKEALDFSAALDFGSIAAQACAELTITATGAAADNAIAASWLASGRVVIAWPTFQVGSCQVIAGQATVSITDGTLSVQLYPNDAATPVNTSYRVTYYLRSGRVTTEYWVVPTSATPVSLALVRSVSVPVPTVMFGQTQVTNLVADLAKKVELPPACPAGKFLQANGSANPPQVACVDGTGAPLATATQSGTVKTDVTETDPRVYTQTTSDTLLAAKANATHAHAAADITSGVLDAARLPAPTATTLGGVRSGACSGTDKVTGISTAGDIACGTDQSGGSSSQHQVNAANLASNDPVNFQDSATVAFSNPSAGNIQAAVKDASVTAAKLSVSNPSAGQLSGVGDGNIASAALSPDRIAGTAEVLANKGAANGYSALDSSSKVIQDPASAQTTAAASKIPKADAGGKIADGWLSASVSLLGQSIEDAELASNYSGVGACTNQFVRNVNDNAAPTCATVQKSDAASTFVHTDQSNAYSTGTQDFESASVTRPFRRLAFASFPGTCTANREFLERSDPATAGQVLYVCNSTGNGWDLVGDGGGSSGVPSPGANGMVACTGTNCSTSAARTITGTTNEISVSNGDGGRGTQPFRFLRRWT